LLDPIKIDPRTFLREHCQLPALPEVITGVRKILTNREINLEEVANLLSGCPALVSQALKVVNSAYYGLPTEISDFKLAIGFLGLDEINRLVISFAVVDTLAIERKAELKDLWFHSLHTAMCAKYLAKRNKVHTMVEDLWSAALLHDLGKFVYLKFFPKHFAALNAHAQENGCPFSTAEAELDLPSSAYFGTLLCDHWRLPMPVRDSCELHTLETIYEADKSVSLTVSTHLVCVSNLLSSLSNDPLNDDIKEEIVKATRKALDYDESRFATLMVEVEDIKADVEDFMHQFA
jgi:HD-like signal output (HDOD) protein